MNDSVKIEPHGGAVGLYRLLFWNYHSKRYEFPPFSEFMRLRFGDTALRPHFLDVCRRLRFELLQLPTNVLVIITPYPI